MSEKIPLVFAPGFRNGYFVESLQYRGTHDRLFRVLQVAGFDPHFFQPEWRNPDPLAWAKAMADFAREIARQSDSRRVALAGFSCGALIATLAAAQLEENPSEVTVSGLADFSLSGWFGLDRVRRSQHQPVSDLHRAPEALKDALSQLELPALHCPVQLYAGTKELRHHSSHAPQRACPLAAGREHPAPRRPQHL